MIPTRSKILGFGATIPIVASAATAALAPPLRSGIVPRAGIVWAGTVLAFLGGVRRGLSFRTPGGPHQRQLAGMARSFGLAFAALLLSPRPSLSCSLLAIGFSDVAINDPAMAKRGEAPNFFIELRPMQMTLAVASLLALAVLLPKTPRDNQASMKEHEDADPAKEGRKGAMGYAKGQDDRHGRKGRDLAY